MVITKLLEALYRRGYDLDGEFKGMVKTCNSVREDQEKETTNPRHEVLKAIVTVEKAMGEAIKIAMKAESYSFFSQIRSVGQYVFNLKDLQSYIVSKARGKITSELAHVMHYYDVDPVPSFQALIASKSKESKPLKLKFLSDTPLQLHRGLNMLMPAATPAEAASHQDEPMANASEEGPVAMEVEVVAELATPNPPPPPMDPLIEDFDEKMEQVAEEEDPQSDRIISAVVVEDEKKEEIESTGYAGGSARGPPVVLTPARPEHDQPSQDTFVPPRPKAMPKASTEKTTDQINKETEEASRATKMTTEVKQVPKRPEAKSRPPQGTESAPSDVTSLNPTTDATMTYAPPSVGTEANAPIDRTDVAGGDLWAHYRGTGQDVRDSPNDPQYVETSKGVIRVPTPPRPSREEGEVATPDAVPDPGKGKGHGQPKGKWRPVLEPQNDPQRSEKGASRSRFQNIPSGSDAAQGKGKEKGTTKGKGKRGRGGKGKAVWSYTEEYHPTGIWGHIGRVRADLNWYYPEEYDYELTNFWKDDYDNQWYVRRTY